MANNVSGSVINKNNKSNINFICASGGSYNRKIFNINIFVTRNESILT